MRNKSPRLSGEEGGVPRGTGLSLGTRAAAGQVVLLHGAALKQRHDLPEQHLREVRRLSVRGQGRPRGVVVQGKAGPAALGRLQAELLDALWPTLKPGG